MNNFRRINMTAATVVIPRIQDMAVQFLAKGAAYPEDASSASTVTMTAEKIAGSLRIAEEDVEDDKLADYVDEKKTTAGSSFAKLVDNAALGTSAAKSGVTVPFTSIYRSLTTADAATGYTADANVLTANAAAWAGSGGYTQISQLLARIEDGDYFDDGDLAIIASPAYRPLLRDVRDTTGRPIFETDYINGREVTRVMGIDVTFTRGARVTATPAINPVGGAGVKGTAGNSLLFVIQKNAAVIGVRKDLESVYIPGRDGTSAMTDEDILKVRARIAAGATVPGAHAVLELIA
ncbi:MAG: hypothetical protein ACRC2H_00090 [Silanimonas sp.]